jgi:Flp pilus assembly protein TadG
MKQHIAQLKLYLWHFLARSTGAASVEFVILVPLVMTVFLASFESGITMIRKTLLDYSVESTMRELRLGKITEPTVEILKTKICDRMLMVNDCTGNLTLELNVRSTASNILLPSITNKCINSATRVEPVLLFQAGAANDLVLVRACLVQDIIFPISVAAMRTVNNTGTSTNYEYQLISTTAFVNEPR